MPEPPLVARARALAAELGFDRSCTPEAGRLLHLLAAQRGRTRVGEIGSGSGVGSAWLASALRPGTTLVTVELDAVRAAAVARLFRDDPDVHVLHGDWHSLLPPEAPFDLLFHDGGKQRPDVDGEQTLGLLAPGGTVVLDDLTPGRAGPDAVREFWLGHPRLAAAEVGLSARESAIVATRVV